MNEELSTFEKTKDFLICIDSDGCVMDTMDVKHMRCFGPCLVHEWNLNEYKDEIVRLWRKMNLFGAERGVNRFKGLAEVLAEINENYTRVEGLDEYIYWVQTTDELSEESLQEAFEKLGGICLRKAMNWSRLVNQSMAMISDRVKIPFEGAEEALKKLCECADVVVLSAANGCEIKKEWEKQGLSKYASLLLSQEAGRKGDRLKNLTAKGYDLAKVLVIGDAPADLEAAREAGVLFAPILAYQERESWELFPESLKRFLAGTYAGEYEAEKIKEFKENLNIR